jgi:ABC-type branched-subunit amino acid transport system ATPase component
MTDSLTIRSATKRFNGVTALDSVSARFDPGTVTGVIGPNGAGKTTLFNAVSGLIRLDSGDVVSGGQTISGLPAWRIAHCGIGRLFQDVRCFEELTVMENVQVGFRRQPGEHLTKLLLAPWASRNGEADQRAIALEHLRQFGLDSFANLPAGALSFGQQKLLCIAALLVAEAHTVLLDEPTAGIDPAMRRRVAGVIRGLAAAGRTVIVIEHNMSVISDIADRAYFMIGGRVAAFGPAAEVIQDARVRSTYISGR